MKGKNWFSSGIRYYPGGRREFKIWDGQHEIAAIPIVQGSNGTEEEERTRLFTVAPILLEACRGALHWLRDNGDCPQPLLAIAELEEAIAKFEGQESTHDHT